MQSDDRDKRVIGLYGEMRFAMELHTRGWQVYRAYIDDKFDFVITKSYCTECKAYRGSFTRKEKYKGEMKKTVTQLCEKCKSDSLVMIVRFIQVKTSEGINKDIKKGIEVADFDFHAKIRYHLSDKRVFYAWIQVWDPQTHDVNYFIFNTDDVSRFDNLDLDTYQITDNQKTRLKLDLRGSVKKKGRKYDYSAFESFLNNFDCLEELLENDSLH